MMNEARLNFVARKIAPHRKAIAIITEDPFVVVHLECGHSINCVNHFSYRLGDSHPCGECGKMKAMELPEFQDVLP